LRPPVRGEVWIVDLGLAALVFVEEAVCRWLGITAQGVGTRDKNV
jgi:hypothetical protein